MNRKYISKSTLSFESNNDMITRIIEHVSLNYNALFQSVKKNAKLLILNLKFNHYYSLLAKNFRTNELSEHEGHTSL